MTEVKPPMANVFPINVTIPKRKITENYNEM